MITLRKAVEEDLKILHNIEKQVYPVPWSMAFFKMMFYLNQNLFIVATDGEKHVGYVVGELKRMGTSLEPQQVGHVLNVAVTPDYQRRGIGTRLMDEMEEKFLQLDTYLAYLEVRESNKVAQRMYRERGYEYVRTAVDYYGDEDAFIMMKHLTR